MRMTSQREIILEELRKTTSHPTADELYVKVKKRLPRISLATVYRNLERMAEMGMIQKIEVAGAQKRFDGNPEFHYHIRCAQCGKVDDLHMDFIQELEDLQSKSVDLRGYKLLGYRLELIGICPDCQKMTN